MKKFIAIIAAIALIATMSVAVFAADTTIKCPDSTAVDGDATGFHTVVEKDVKVELTGNITHVICVDVTWGSMEFTYDGDMIWDPHTLQYKADPADLDAEWACEDGADEIVFVNKSDVDVTVTGAWSTTNVADVDTESDVTCTMAPVNLGKVVVDVEADTAQTTTGTMTVVPANAPTIVEDTGLVTVGAVTISVAAA